MSGRLFGVVAVGVLIVLIGAFLLGNGNSGVPVPNSLRQTNGSATVSTVPSGTVSQAPTVQISPTVSKAAEDIAVSYTSGGFSPASVTVKAGNKVTWTNEDGALSLDSDPHPAHTDYAPLNLGMIQKGSSKSLTFDKPGTYKYHNHLNASHRGTVVVQ